MGISQNITDVFGTLHDTIGSFLGTTPTPVAGVPAVRILTAAQASDLMKANPGFTLPMLTALGYAIVG